MCDRCEIDMLMFGEIPDGFRCSDVTPELLAEESGGIPRFPGLKKKPADQAGEAPKEELPETGAKTDTGP